MGPCKLFWAILGVSLALGFPGPLVSASIFFWKGSETTGPCLEVVHHGIIMNGFIRIPN